ncbi:MAG: hypothetical protein PVI59_15515 [Anaerolineae bacterium]
MSNGNPPRRDPQSGSYAAAILILIGVMAGLALVLPVRLGRGWWIWVWIINLVLMFVVIGVAGIGLGAKGGFWAAFVDTRNMVSLSRFQIVLWTVVVLSAFWTIGLTRVGDYWFGGHAERYVWQAPESTFESPVGDLESEQEPPGDADAEEEEPSRVGPLALRLPPVLWALMGISITSAVASPLIKQDKKQRTEGSQTEYDRMLQVTLRGPGDGQSVPRAQDGESGHGAEFNTAGAVVYRNEGFDPKFFDIFRGEDPKSLFYLDIGKVQNFFFTVVAVVTYALALGAAIGAAESIAGLFDFPDVAEGLLAVLGISHGGYLVTKVTNMPSPDPPPPEPPPPEPPTPPST